MVIITKEDVLDILKELNRKQTETISIEVKSANLGKPEKYYDTISSFANTIGGVILFGIEEIKKKNKVLFNVVGVYDVNDLQKSITNLCSDEFEPIIRPHISVVEIDGKNVVAVQIESLKMKFKPCYYKPKGLHNGAFIRVGDRDDHMTEYEIYKCISYKENVSDDKRPVIEATLDDLDNKLIELFISKYIEDKPNFSKFSKIEILLNAGVITKVEDKIFPTVAGIMVFGIYPQKYFPQWFIAAIVVPGFEIAELGPVGERFVDNKRIEGNIETMYQETIRFLNRNMKVGMRLNPKTGLREDLPEYPIDALREAVSNILLHRDLSQYKERVYSKITVFKDRIEFRNVGNLYGDNTIEKIKDTSINVEVRNEVMVRLVEIMGGVLENRHTGIKTMIDEMKRNNLPEPVFANEREDFVVTFYNGEYRDQDKKTQDKKTQDKKTQDKKTQDKKILKMNKILELCKEPKSVKEIMEILDYKSTKTFKRDYIIPLINDGKLEMTIPEKPTSKNQKYITKEENYKEGER